MAGELFGIQNPVAVGLLALEDAVPESACLKIGLAPVDGVVGKDIVVKADCFKCSNQCPEVVASIEECLLSLRDLRQMGQSLEGQKAG